MIVFISGSKISAAPDLWTLTERIRSAALHLGSDNRLWTDVCSRGYGRADYATLVPAFFTYLTENIARWRSCDQKSISYEQIGAICSSLAIEFGTARNAALGPFWRTLANKFGSSIRPKPDHHEGLAELCDVSLRWIRQVVARELKLQAGWSDPAYNFLRHMPIAVDTWASVTLNHDLVLEDAFSRLGQTIETGFGHAPSLSPFQPQALRKPLYPLLLKPHGSINWFFDATVGEVLCEGVEDAGALHRRAYSGAEINVGTFNKLEDYSSNLYPFIFGALDRVLERARGIIVSGYGFTDDGINSRLFNELHYRSSLELFVIHPNPKQLIANSSPFARHHFSDLKDSQLHWSACPFGEATKPPFVNQLDSFVQKNSA